MRNGFFLNVISLLFGLVVATFSRLATGADFDERFANALDGGARVLESSVKNRKNVENFAVGENAALGRGGDRLDELKFAEKNEVFANFNFFEENPNSEKNAESRRAADPLRRDKTGVQTLYPGVCKIVGRGVAEKKEDGAEATPLYYGTGSFVAEIGDWGLVLTNWHVVSEANESIDVVFPNFSSPAKILLRDEIWDLSALLICKPPEVAPIPIALEVPQIGETLWTAGYGQSGGLADFQIGAGPLLNYVELVEPENLPLETLAIGKGVRQGDSGGPIFNRYGELAGILWGSDGKVTMGTFCVRVQFFLTQAIRRLIVLKADAESRARWAKGVDGSKRGKSWGDADAVRRDDSADFLRWNAELFCADAERSNISAREGLKLYGVFPISQDPVYVAPDGGADAETLCAASREVALKTVDRVATAVQQASSTSIPPSPPIFSPTFVVQQRNLNCARPEIAEPEFYTNLIAANLEKIRQKTTSSEVPENAESAETTDEAAEALLTGVRETAPVVSLTGTSGRRGGFSVLSGKIGNEEDDETGEIGAADALDLTLKDDANGANQVAADEGLGQNGKKEEKNARGWGVGDQANERDRDSTAELGDKIAAENQSVANGNDVSLNLDLANVAENGEGGARNGTFRENASVSEKTFPLDLDSFTGLQIYVVICVIFCLFYNAARLLALKNSTNGECGFDD